MKSSSTAIMKIKGIKGIFLFILLNIAITSIVGAKFERKLLQNIDNGGDVRMHFGYGNKRLTKPNRTVGPNSLSETTDKSKVDILSGIFRNSVQRRYDLRRKELTWCMY